MHGSSGGGFIVGKLVFPVNYEEEVSQRLVDALHGNDVKLASECLADPFVDVNFFGTVSLKAKKAAILLHGESVHEVLVDYKEFKTEVTPLFLAAHVSLRRQFALRALVSACCRGFVDVVDMLIKVLSFLFLINFENKSKN